MKLKKSKLREIVCEILLEEGCDKSKLKEYSDKCLSKLESCRITIENGNINIHTR